MASLVAGGPIDQRVEREAGKNTPPLWKRNSFLNQCRIRSHLLTIGRCKCRVIEWRPISVQNPLPLMNLCILVSLKHRRRCKTHDPTVKRNLLLPFFPPLLLLFAFANSLVGSGLRQGGPNEV